MSELPEPLTPANSDLRGLPFMPLDIVRLFDSDIYALSTGDEFKAALTLWGKAWLQVPSASLPNDERILAHLSGAGPRWKKMRAMALRGFVLCSDNRLYHPVIAEKAAEAWQARLRQRDKSKRANTKRWGSSGDSSAASTGHPSGDPRGDGDGDAIRPHGDASGHAHGDPSSDPKGQFKGQGEGIIAADTRAGVTITRAMMDALFEAAGNSLNRPSAPDLEVMARPLHWLGLGYDMDLDILPTIRIHAAKGRPFTIRSWNYFDGPIADAHARRTRPMPKGNHHERTNDRASEGDRRLNATFAGILASGDR